jgi:hypothetical protein
MRMAEGAQRARGAPVSACRVHRLARAPACPYQRGRWWPRSISAAAAAEHTGFGAACAISATRAWVPEGALLGARLAAGVVDRERSAGFAGRAGLFADAVAPAAVNQRVAVAERGLAISLPAFGVWFSGE